LLSTGNPNASIPTPQPVRPRPMFGAFGAAVGANSVVFVSKVGLRHSVILFNVNAVTFRRFATEKHSFGLFVGMQ